MSSKKALADERMTLLFRTRFSAAVGPCLSQIGDRMGDPKRSVLLSLDDSKYKSVLWPSLY